MKTKEGGRRRRGSPESALVFAALLAGLATPPSGAHAPARQVSLPEPIPAESTDERLRRLEATVSRVLDENRKLSEQNREILDRYRDLSDRHEGLRQAVEARPPAAAELFGGANPTGPSLSSPDVPHDVWPGPPPVDPRVPRGSARSPLHVSYDNGFLLEPDDIERIPFTLKFNFWSQLRYTGFSRAVTEWTDSAGVTRTVDNRNDFQLNRGRMIFSGIAIDPKLGYAITIDYNTLRRQNLDLITAWLYYDFGRAFRLHGGKVRVTGVREWQTSATDVMGLERSMATTFFRPSFTAGLWATGEPIDRLHYQLVIGNGFNTGSLSLDDLDDNFGFSGDLRWEPLGDFGRFYSDLELHESPVVRLGNNLVNARQEGRQNEDLGPEATAIRLSDGTNLTDLGALAPGVTVASYNITLYTIDAGFKYRGLSLTSEYFLRWIRDIRGDGPIPESRRNLFDTGAYAQVGYFLIPQFLELYGRTSLITGPFGSGSEVGGGLSWFPIRDSRIKFTLDATKVNASPADQDRTGYRAGDSGTLFRAQFQARY